MLVKRGVRLARRVHRLRDGTPREQDRVRARPGPAATGTSQLAEWRIGHAGRHRRRRRRPMAPQGGSSLVRSPRSHEEGESYDASSRQARLPGRLSQRGAALDRRRTHGRPPGSCRRACRRRPHQALHPQRAGRPRSRAVPAADGPTTPLMRRLFPDPEPCVDPVDAFGRLPPSACTATVCWSASRASTGSWPPPAAQGLTARHHPLISSTSTTASLMSARLLAVSRVTTRRVARSRRWVSASARSGSASSSR